MTNKDDLVSKDTALKMAIEALEHASERSIIINAYEEVIDVCKEALEQPSQEPLTQEKYEQLKNQSTQWTSSLPMFVHLINKHFGINDGLDWGQK
jgi:hypothetical protein